MPRPLIPILTAFIAGIAAMDAAPLPESWLLPSLGLAFLLFLVSALRQRKSIAYPCLYLSFFLLGALNAGRDLYPAPGPRDVARYALEEKMTIEGLVSENPRVLPDRVDLIVEPSKIFLGRRIIPVEGRILLTIRDGRIFPEYGDLIRFKAKLKPPRNFRNPGGFDYRRFLRLKGVSLRGTMDKSGFARIRSGGGHPLKARLEGFRNRLRKAIRENASSPEGEILQAMILGEQSEIPREVLDKFNRTGTSHIIAISGFNIGIIAAFSFFVVRAAMKSWGYLLLRFDIVRTSTAFAVIPVVLYAFIAGFGVSVARAALMILACLAAVFFGKEREPFNVLALSGLLILSLSPLSLFDVSFQLSFAAVASILLITPVCASFFPGRKGPDGRPSRTRKALYAFLLFLAASLSATLGAAPLIVYYFNLLSLITLLANILIVPIMGYLVILLGMAIVVAAPLFPALTAALVKAASLLTGLSLSIAETLSGLPGAYTFLGTPTPVELGAYYLLLFTGVKWISLRRESGNPGLEGPAEHTAALCKISFCLLLFFFVLDGIYLHLKDRHPQSLRTVFIDVGQGTSTFCDLPGGAKMLVDGGGFHDGSFDVGRYVLAPFLWHEKIRKLDIAVLSHPHPDHLCGLLYVLENFHVREVWSNGDAEDSESYDRFRRIIREKGILHRIVKRGFRREIGGARIDVLNPGGRAAGDDADANDRSLVLKISYGKIGLLLPGDIAETTESRLIENGMPLKSTVLAAPHHGASSSSSAPFLKRVRPDTVIFSCGAGNLFHFPHPDVLERYRRIGARIFRTDLDGAVRLDTDGDSFRVTSFAENAE